MKKWLSAFTISASLLLGGCSFFEDANNTLTYVNEATDYVNEAKTFANDVPSLAEQAVTDSQAATELETRLEEMKADIEAFNKLEAPEVAADLHGQMVEQNNRALEGINLYLDHIEGGKLDPGVVENTELFKSIQEITSITEQIKQLGS
ncbi:hypothetical protein FZC66_09095 [Priestia megaterium]|nr:hypothetical protein FZC66_09095 [Priestia megaterium]